MAKEKEVKVNDEVEVNDKVETAKQEELTFEMNYRLIFEGNKSDLVPVSVKAVNEDDAYKKAKAKLSAEFKKALEINFVSLIKISK